MQIVPGDTKAGGGVRYTPNANFFGTDTFTYTISDGKGGTDTATVNVIVSDNPDVPSPVDDKFTTRGRRDGHVHRRRAHRQRLQPRQVGAGRSPRCSILRAAR